MSGGLTASQLAETKAQMKQLIEQNPLSVSFTHFRLNTLTVPSSFDPDYREVTDRSEITWDKKTIPGEIFWSINEEALWGLFGGTTTAVAEVHVAPDADIKTDDYLEIEGKSLHVIKIIENATFLQVFVELGYRTAAPIEILPPGVLSHETWGRPSLIRSIP